MRNIWTIARRDLRSYFTSPLAYIVIALFLGIMGFMFFMGLYYFVQANSQYQSMHMGKAPTITDGIIRPVFGNMNVIYLFLIPFITSRLLAEERKLHTIELLVTSPVTLTEIVIGKFLAAAGLVTVMLALTLVYPAVLFWTGNPEWGPIFTSYIGTLLMAFCYLSMGLFFSATTDNQIVAGTLTFAFILFFWLINWASQMAGPVLGEVLNYLSLINHFNNFGQGMLNTPDIFYYLSFTGIGLFLAHRVLDSYRWR